ncbi:barstar family protein [Streptomyces sp. NBC_01558]|uniref:barstar family protein n=1 Tax=Streptomyces sp. NBC_01558 TaxID=2975878 RepID=UPI002DD88074|nr:hypothetical protein [Streptomyces sp. NBC_01558]WSD78169.1 barstar family protein [Streptomyces sp. NBC_01558]
MTAGEEPPKYRLVPYEAEAAPCGTEAPGEPWALCADAEGLFGAPPPPSRRTYELLGCAPQGDLRKALPHARARRTAPLGTLRLESLDRTGERADSWTWCLEDVRVLGDRPRADDPSLVDITVEASESAENATESPRRPPLSPGYLLLGAEEEPWGTCRDLAHIRLGPEPAEAPIRLLGCSPGGALRAALDAGDEDLGHGQLLRLDVHGSTVQEAVEGEVTAWIPSARGRGLVDLALDPWSERPPPGAAEVWDLWWEGRPSAPGLWARCGHEARSCWLDTARHHHPRDAPSAPAGTTFHLDGRHMTDHPGFHCALGEAVNGPGGYLGRSLDTLGACLRGGWGAERPFTLVWHASAVARSCLGATPHTDFGRIPPTDHRPPAFEELLAFLGEKGVDVRLD